MADGHWLDPLARSLLEATGQLPAKPRQAEAPGQPAPPSDSKGVPSNLLAKGTEVSVTEARKRLQITNPSAVIAQLRADGARIYTNTRTVNGKTVSKYRLDVKRTNLS